MSDGQLCSDCGVKPGERHEWGCDVTPCKATGQQLLQCPGELHEFAGREYGEHEGECGPIIWTGVWPGKQECVELNLYAKLVPGRGWVRTHQNDPESTEDLNTLALLHRTGRLVWSPALERLVIPTQLPTNERNT